MADVGSVEHKKLRNGSTYRIDWYSNASSTDTFTVLFENTIDNDVHYFCRTFLGGALRTTEVTFYEGVEYSGGTPANGHITNDIIGESVDLEGNFLEDVTVDSYQKDTVRRVQSGPTDFNFGGTLGRTSFILPPGEAVAITIDSEDDDNFVWFETSFYTTKL